MLQVSKILLAAVVIFFGIYAWLATPLPVPNNVGPRFDWPDETANYFFAKKFKETGNLKLHEPLEESARDLIRPRSFNVKDNYLLPGSFPGLPMLYGLLARLLSLGAVIYFTPLFSVLGVLAFYGIVRRFFAEKIAVLASLLLLFAPGWWYYSATTMLPNVTFVSLVLIGTYFMIRLRSPLELSQHYSLINNFRIVPSDYVMVLLSGLTYGLAVAIRPAEIVWVMVVAVAAAGWVRFINLKYALVFFTGVALMVAPTLYQQHVLYGSWSSTGYDFLQKTGPSCSFCHITSSLFFPFGFNFSLLRINFWDHFVINYLWWVVPALLGLWVWIIKKKPQLPQVGFYTFSTLVSALLIVMYGSWHFTDPLTVDLNTLGVSYVRYWLPVTLLILPLVAEALVWISEKVGKKEHLWILTPLVLILLYTSMRPVLWSEADSLLPVRQREKFYQELSYQVNQKTENDAVIISIRKDKVFFPDRRVIHTFEPLIKSEDLLLALPGLIKKTPVYYVASNVERLPADSKLTLESVASVPSEICYPYCAPGSGSILYKISLRKADSSVR